MNTFSFKNQKEYYYYFLHHKWENLDPKLGQMLELTFFLTRTSNQIIGPYLKRPLVITGGDEKTGSKGQKKDDRTFKLLT